MNEEWKDLEEAWRAEPAREAANAAEAGRFMAGRRAAAFLRGWVVTAAAVSVAVFLASLWLLLRWSEGAYTFAVLLWSAYFSAGAYWVSMREPPGEYARPTVDALGRRAQRLERSGHWLDFARTLVGVEVLIAAGFWMVLARGGREGAEWLVMAILLAGGLLYGRLWGMLQRVRRERNELAAVVAELIREA